jgi:UDP-GlcNAc:undecaprenyl-phosphate GlcNAc-1-phosphate transferase
LFFNFSVFQLPKLFLGDSGSLLLGFIISFFLIYLGSQNLIHPILLAWSIAIFVYEFLSINLIRLKTNYGLFKAGQDHLHHLIFKKTKSIFLTNSILFMTNILLFIIGYLSYLIFNALTSLIFFITFFLLFLFFRGKMIEK